MSLAACRFRPTHAQLHHVTVSEVMVETPLPSMLGGYFSDGNPNGRWQWLRVHCSHRGNGSTRSLGRLSATVNQGLRHLTKGLTDDEGVQANDKLVEVEGGGDRCGPILSTGLRTKPSISAPIGRKL